MYKIDNARTKQSKVKQHDMRESGKKVDPRFLNYYDLKRGETLTIRLLPVSEDIPEESLSWKAHGPNIRSSDVEPIQCVWHRSKEKCPICKKMFELKENSDTEHQGEMLSGKFYTLAQCVVLDQPDDFELVECEDGNPVKLFWMPWAIKELIDEDMFTGDLEDINGVDIVIKKSIKNKRSDYSRSYWEEGDELPAEFVELLENGEAYLHDITDLVPPVLDKIESKKWLRNAMDVIEEKLHEEEEDDEDDDDSPRKSSSKKSSSTSSKKSSRRRQEEDDEEDVHDEEDPEVKEEDEEEDEPRSKSKSSGTGGGKKKSAKDVLAKYKKASKKR